MVEKTGRVQGKNGFPDFWWAALPCIPGARDSDAYRRLRTIWGDQTRFRGSDEKRCAEFVAPHLETSLTVTLWENFALFPPSLWVPALADLCGIASEVGSVAACRWSYGWSSEQPKAILDIVVHFRSKSGEAGLLVIEAKRPGGDLKLKDREAGSYLDLPALQAAAPFARRWLLFCVDAMDKDKLMNSLAPSPRWRALTWQELGGLQISLVEKLSLEEPIERFVAGAMQYQYCQHDIKPSTLAAKYLVEEPSIEAMDSRNGGNGLRHLPPTAPLWLLP